MRPIMNFTSLMSLLLQKIQKPAHGIDLSERGIELAIVKGLLDSDELSNQNPTDIRIAFTWQNAICLGHS